MQKFLNSEAECRELADALATLVGEGSARGLRINTLKWKKGPVEFLSFLEEFGFKTHAPTPWCGNGYFISAKCSSQLGSHPIAAAGLIYLQEPGAMEAVE